MSKVQAIAEELFEKLQNVEVNNNTYDFEFCSSIADDVEAIQRLKKEKNAIILAHSYHRINFNNIFWAWIF